MITAAEAMKLDRALLSDEERRQFHHDKTGDRHAARNAYYKTLVP